MQILAEKKKKNAAQIPDKSQNQVFFFQPDNTGKITQIHSS